MPRLGFVAADETDCGWSLAFNNSQNRKVVHRVRCAESWAVNKFLGEREQALV